MRKVLAFLLVISMAISFVACAVEEVPVTSENAMDVLYGYSISTKESTLKEGVLPEASDSEASTPPIIYELPDISNYDLAVKGNGEIDVEVFLPVENNGSSILDMVSYVAEEFNAKKVMIDDKTISVSVRALEATLAEEYILNGTYFPKGYIAANELYGLLMQENGIDVSLVSAKTVGNTMGIVIEKAKYEELKAKYGEVTIQTIVKANEAGEIAIGYTNPTNNPTGLNFVISMLSYFDAGNPMSFEATTDFSRFQSAVSQVSFDTNQMKKAVENGALDAFVMEYQAFTSDDSLSNFEFMPFGTRHDNPLYAVGTLSETETEVLKEFSNSFNSVKVQEHAKSLAFNKNEDYESTVTISSGDFITTVLNLWKEQRAAQSNVSVIFVADVSGSMDGENIKNLKNSLLNAMQYVGEKTRVGLLSYSGTVYIDLELSEFDEEHQKYFVGAVDSWRANGGTATNNALIIANRMLVEDREENPDSKQIIILLSDGYTGDGYSLKRVSGVIDFLDIPIYTIGYGKDADAEELTNIANLNGGTFIAADTDDISYTMKTLFNAET